MILSEQFELEFEEYRKSHPDANFSVFWTSRNAKMLREGGAHNSLGKNITTRGVSDFWETGARQIT